MKFFLIYSLLFSFISLIFVFFQFYLTIYNHDLYKRYNLNYKENTYCQKNYERMSEIEKLACKNKYKKSKFIWLNMDGLPSDILYSLKNIDKYKILNLFYVNIVGIRITGCSHETEITGHYSTNLHYNTIKKDNIFTQMKNIGNFIDFEGLDVPYGYYFEDRQVFDNITIYEDLEPYSLNWFCDININITNDDINNYFKSYLTKTGDLKDRDNLEKIYNHFDEYFQNIITSDNENFNKCFNEKGFLSKDKSLLYYSDNFDKINHQHFKYHYKNIQNLYAFEKTVIELLKWIDNNPDYALIISSDHGGIETPLEETFYMHGMTNKTNYAIFMIYTKELKDKYDEWKKGIETISLLNVAPTIAQILTDVNIPIESTGIPQFLGDDEILRVSAVKSKEFQIRSFIEEFISKYNNDKLFSKIIEKLNNNKFKEFNSLSNFTIENSNLYLKFLIDIQNDIIGQLKKFNLKKYGAIEIVLILLLNIKLIFDIGLFFKEKIGYNNEKNKIFEIIFKCLISFILIFEPIFLLIFNKYDLNKCIRILREINIGLLGLLCIYIYIINKNSSNDNSIIIISILFMFLMIPISILFNHFHFLFKINQFLFFYYKYKVIFEIILILVSFSLFFYFIMKLKEYYFLNFKYPIFYLYFIMGIIFHILCFICQFYDDGYIYEEDSNHFFQSLDTIYQILGWFLFLFSFFSYKKKNKYNDAIFLNEKKLLFLFKINYYLYFLLNSNSFERIFWFFILIPILELFVYSYKNSNYYYRIIFVISLIFIINLFFINSFIYKSILFSHRRYHKNDIIFKKSFSKPIFLARYFILLSIYLISIGKFSKKFIFTKSTYFMFFILSIWVDGFYIFYLIKLHISGIENEYSSDINFLFFTIIFTFFTFNFTMNIFVAIKFYCETKDYKQIVDSSKLLYLKILNIN